MHISLFGNFTFPTEGQFANGLQLKPLAGVGNVVDKTQAQIERLSGRQIPVAGATGASISEEEPAPEPSQCPTQFPDLRNEGYVLKFIQHAPEQSVVASLHDIEVDQLPAREAGKWICPETWSRKENSVQPSSEGYNDCILQDKR